MIENARDTDEGVYECVARNQLGEVKAEAVELRYLDDTRPGALIHTHSSQLDTVRWCVTYVKETDGTGWSA